MDVSISTTVYGPAGEEVLPLSETLGPIRDSGFQWIELSRKHADLACNVSAIAAAGLKVWAVHGGLGGGSISEDEAERKATVELEMERLEESAPFAPCPYVIHYLHRCHDAAVGERFKKSLEELLRRAEELDIVLAVETCPYKPEVNIRYPASNEVAEFVRSFDSDHMRVTVDLNHSNLQEDLIDVARNCMGLVANIHVSDNTGHREEHLLPGDGIIDFRESLQGLVDAGYEGPLNLEVHTPSYPTPDELAGLYRWATETAAMIKAWEPEFDRQL